MSTFQDFGLSDSILNSLQRLGISTPTPIQAQSIPPALLGRDLLASAETGSGKTLAYMLPVLVGLMKDQKAMGLVLTPTRELAVQVYDGLQDLLGRKSPVGMALLIGGEPMSKQFSQLRWDPNLIIGTPGRINDHLERGSLELKDTRFLVLDETDRMLDMGFGPQVDAIVAHIPSERQTLMFSATFPQNIARLANRFLKNPERISIGSSTKPVDKIEQKVVHVPGAQKFPQLLQELAERDGSVIVFVRTRRGAASLAERLQRQEHSADAIHGDLYQRKREKVMEDFRNGKNRILVATDVAARGIDVPHVKHVINYDLPQCPEDYIHRIGRTARAGAEGNALCIISPEEAGLWDQIHRFINPEEWKKSQPYARPGERAAGANPNARSFRPRGRSVGSRKRR